MRKYRILYSETVHIDIEGVLKIDFGRVDGEGDTVIYNSSEIDSYIVAVIPKNFLVFEIEKQ